jgi:hypothetical protein
LPSPGLRIARSVIRAGEVRGAQIDVLATGVKAPGAGDLLSSADQYGTWAWRRHSRCPFSVGGGTLTRTAPAAYPERIATSVPATQAEAASVMA